MTPDTAASHPGERSPEGPPGGSAVFLLSSLGFVASRRFQEALQSVQLEPRMFAVLNVIALSEASSQQALAERLGIAPSAMVAIVDELEDRGLVKRRRNHDDRRAYALRITSKGQTALDKARHLAQQNEQRFCAPLQPAERDQLLDLLRRLAAGQDVPAGVHPGLTQPQ